MEKYFVQIIFKKTADRLNFKLAEIRPFTPDRIKHFLQKKTDQLEDQILAINRVYNLADLAT